MSKMYHIYGFSVVQWIFVVFIFHISYTLCEQSEYYQLVTTCPRDFIKLGRKCYFFGKVSESWADAHHECVKRNSSLASILNKGQDKIVRNYVNKRFTNDRHERWIGGKFNDKLHIWVWGASGTPLKFTSFVNKTSKDLTWHCILLDPDLDNWWNAKNCMESKPYICQSHVTIQRKTKAFDFRKCDYAYELTRYETNQCIKHRGYVGQHPNDPAAYVQTTPSTVRIVKPLKTRQFNYICPSNMYLIGKKCYFFSKVPKSWHEAHYACQEINTTLAIINNKKHDFKIREFLTDGFVVEADRWIGGLYDEGVKRWKWLNGNIIYYKGFARIGLRNKKLPFGTIFMDPRLQYRWNVSNRMHKKHYICQTKAKTIVLLGDYKNNKKLRRPDATITILADNKV